MGTARIKEAIPILKKDMAHWKANNFEARAYEIALAALGDTASLRKIFAVHQKVLSGTYVERWGMRDDFYILGQLIQTQQSFALMADWMDTTKTEQLGAGHAPNAPFVYYCNRLAHDLLSTIKNKDFKEQFLKVPARPEDDPLFRFSLSAAQVLFIRDWLVNNKGRYEFW